MKQIFGLKNYWHKKVAGNPSTSLIPGSSGQGDVLEHHKTIPEFFPIKQPQRHIDLEWSALEKQHGAPLQLWFVLSLTTYPPLAGHLVCGARLRLDAMSLHQTADGQGLTPGSGSWFQPLADANPGRQQWGLSRASVPSRGGPDWVLSHLGCGCPTCSHWPASEARWQHSPLCSLSKKYTINSILSINCFKSLLFSQKKNEHWVVFLF